jgi:hypothetical protein
MNTRTIVLTPVTCLVGLTWAFVYATTGDNVKVTVDGVDAQGKADA